MTSRHPNSAASLIALSVLWLSLLVGCEKKEKVVDIDTPQGGIEVERSTESGDIKIEIKDE
jgi:hypothetical protein